MILNYVSILQALGLESKTKKKEHHKYTSTNVKIVKLR